MHLSFSAQERRIETYRLYLGHISHSSRHQKASSKHSIEGLISRFKHITEIERIQDSLSKNVKFENAAFNRDDMVRPDLFRTADRSQWISPRGFEQSAK